MKKLKYPSVFLCCCLLVLALSGCSIRLADLSAISTQSVNLDRVDLDTLPQVKNVVGQDSRMMLLFIPLGIPHLENAVDDALTKGGGDIMTDAVISSRGWWFLIGQNTIEVKGNVVNTKGAR